MSTWQSIETAPKDGECILVFNIHNPNTPPTTVHWLHVVDAPQECGWHLSVTLFGEHSEYIWGPPTHWKPIGELPGDERAS